MRGYSFDRIHYVPPPRPVETSAPKQELAPKPPVQLHRDEDFAPPKLPTNVIWIASACIAVGVVIWSVASSVQTRRRVQVLERAVRMLAQRQGIYFQSF